MHEIKFKQLLKKSKILSAYKSTNNQAIPTNINL
jgi:hypothetical protein